MSFSLYGTGMQKQEIPGVTGKCGLGSTKWSTVKANRVFPREHTGHSKHRLPRTQEKTLHMDIIRWSKPKSDWLLFLAAKDQEALYSQQKQDGELTVPQAMNSLLPNSDLKKVGKTTRPFRYELNQIPYDYTVEVTKRFEGSDLIDSVPEELWAEVPCFVQEAVIKTILKKKTAKRQNDCLRRPYK